MISSSTGVEQSMENFSCVFLDFPPFLASFFYRETKEKIGNTTPFLAAIYGFHAEIHTQRLTSGIFSRPLTGRWAWNVCWVPIRHDTNLTIGSGTAWRRESTYATHAQQMSAPPPRALMVCELLVKKKPAARPITILRCVWLKSFCSSIKDEELVLSLFHPSYT